MNPDPRVRLDVRIVAEAMVDAVIVEAVSSAFGT
jgi:hypothetical protein